VPLKTANREKGSQKKIDFLEKRYSMGSEDRKAKNVDKLFFICHNIFRGKTSTSFLF